MHATYADLARPSSRTLGLCYDLLLIGAGSVLVAVAAQVAVPLPFTPVPWTLQPLAVLLVGARSAPGAARPPWSPLAEGASGLPCSRAGRSASRRWSGRPPATWSGSCPRRSSRASSPSAAGTAASFDLGGDGAGLGDALRVRAGVVVAVRGVGGAVEAGLVPFSWGPAQAGVGRPASAEPLGCGRNWVQAPGRP
jgi:hypothetical protein